MSHYPVDSRGREEPRGAATCEAVTAPSGATGDTTPMDLTQPLATIKPQSRSASGRFQRVLLVRWRAGIGASVRLGRPPAVTPELGEEGKRLLREGATVTEVCERLGVDRRSWYRYVRRESMPVRAYRRKHRAPRSISRSLEEQIFALDDEGLPRVVIAQRVGLHINTVVKYLLRAGRRKQP